MQHLKVLNCLFCNEEFESKVKSGVPESEYCSPACRLNDEYDEYGGETFEKFSKGGEEEWH